MAKVIVDGFIFLFFCAGASGVLYIFLMGNYEKIGFFVLSILFIGQCWMISRLAWCTFVLFKRLRLIVTPEQQSIKLLRDVPCPDIDLPARAKLRYDFSWGNFRLDLIQRGNAPRGINIWFDYHGKQFWIPEASSNYRDALHLLAKHADLQYDPTLCRWGRRWYWGMWRDCRKRAELNGVIAEIHHILAPEQGQ